MNNKAKFDLYAQLLREWSKKMNLVAPSTLTDIYNRHFADCAQLADVLPRDKKNIVFTARAFAPLVKILDYVGKTGCRLFLLKGREIPAEIETAQKKYKFDYELIKSRTGDGYIIIIKKCR